ncbi:hypothetical protein FA15DRAFT_659672 [Coprinopsis marcescibilis]|uniref:C2H2-type domain-containing protein n=1 Tax=Coprinopsis marcescibilis TaxID=230819 RepID=A0A5C3KHN8_COPMA|nr:hypothetical protein FA15DRAFT_659672 [Coprinopsis marcescibilis]
MGRASRAALAAATKSFTCSQCGKHCRSQWGLKQHTNALHGQPTALLEDGEIEATVKQFHPRLTGIPVDASGNPLPRHIDPAAANVLDPTNQWSPFQNRHSFDFAHYHFVEVQSSAGQINKALDLWRAIAINATKDPNNNSAAWACTKDMYQSIDDIQQGSAPFQTVFIKYSGPLPENPLAWMLETYELSVRDARQVLHQQLSTTKFAGEFETRPYHQFETCGDKQRVWLNLMSGDWAYEEADTIYNEVEGSEGAMLVPIVSGTDKTTVSVATGHQEYHPYYISAGNLTNTARRSHGSGIIPVAFLPIPKSRIFALLRHWMTNPDIVWCPDGHYRRAIYSIGPVIADYPEQVWLACVVQNWCAKCDAKHDDLNNPNAGRRTHEKTDILLECFDPTILWKSFGVRADVVPFTYYYPHADIHKLMAPNLLHQLIKGTFKDHLVTWVGEYLVVKHGSEAEANKIIAEIDRRVSAAPTFPGLRRFPDGRDFSQWTGDDSKALMKVYLAAIVGFVPDDMVKCIAAFLNACYIFRRNVITWAALELAKLELAKFHAYREIFIETATRTTSVRVTKRSLLIYYRVKTHRCCERAMMLVTITRLDKLHALRQIFAEYGMLAGSTALYTALNLARDDGQRGELGDDHGAVAEYDENHHEAPASACDQSHMDDVCPSLRPRLSASVETAVRYVATYPTSLDELAIHPLIQAPALKTAFLEYLIALQRPNEPIPLDITSRVVFNGKLRVYHSASAYFYAPSDACGARGMQKQVLRCNPNWKDSARYDTVFVALNNTPTISGTKIGQLCLIFSFTNTESGAVHPCAFVNWFDTVGNQPDPITGMWVVERSPHLSERLFSIISIHSIVRNAHLMPVYGSRLLPERFLHTKSLDAFHKFYVNSFVDHHTHEFLSEL